MTFSNIPAPLATMRAITGTLEEDGSNDNPIILAWADEIAERFPEMKLYCAQYNHDSIPWCGLCMGLVFAHNNIRPIFGPTDTDKFLWARAWAQFGTEREGEPQLGDVLVLPGHVTMFDGIAEDGRYMCRGGNQSDSVNVTRYHKDSFIAIRVPPVATATSKPVASPVKPIAPVTADKARFTSIVATVFGGAEDPNNSAYDDHSINDDEMGVALPARFTGLRPKVRVFNGTRVVDCDIVDVGPWNINDKYWETNSRPQAESGTDKSGRTTNRAGIDLTPAAAIALGISGKGIVDWMFIPAQNKPAITTKEEAVVRESSKKMSLLATVRAWIKAGLAAGAGIVTMDNLGLFQAWITTGQGIAATSTVVGLAVGGIAVWWLMNVLDKMSMDDYKAGRWVPSELAATEAAASTPKGKLDAQVVLAEEEVANAKPA